MDKIKFLIIILLGIFSVLYNFSQIGFPKFPDGVILVFLQGQIGSASEETLLGIIFDYLIKFAFNIDLNDIKTYFRIFGV
ncbi:MAG: hypothetical protein ACOX43_03260 [Bacilli bacterium]|jgi:hypothetical protein